MAKQLQHYINLIEDIEKEIRPVFEEIDRIALQNQWRVLEAFRSLRIDDSCFAASTGYGYNDLGREKLDLLYARVFGAEAGIVRPHFVSGTHTIACALYGCLQPGGRLLSLTGRPYDTLQRVLGLNSRSSGILAELNATYDEADFTAAVDEAALDRLLADKAHVILLQRSRGYALRRALRTADIAALVRAVKERQPEAIIFVDNCYGEFVETEEPCHAGADLIAGSLIKNPGGGIAFGGGYIAGRADLVERAAYRLTAPGLGSDIGAMGTVKRLYFQGLFLAPHQVAQSLKGMVLAAALFSRAGYAVDPQPFSLRGDTVQTVTLGSAGELELFCRSVQAASPVDSYVTPQPAPMPGYDDEIIMAAGTFIQGASSEFTADGPLRPPYHVFLQGGLTYEHQKIALAEIMHTLKKGSND